MNSSALQLTTKKDRSISIEVMISQTVDYLNDLRRVRFRLIEPEPSIPIYTEGTNQYFILHKNDVEAFVKWLIRRHGQTDSNVGFEELVVEFPSVHYQAAPKDSDSFAYITTTCWISNYPSYHPAQSMGRIFLNSIRTALECKDLEYDRQSNGHAASCSDDYGGPQCNCKLIFATPEYTDPYIDPHFEEYFNIDLNAEKAMFDRRFAGARRFCSYQKP